MEAYRYEALDPEGRTVTGVLQADTARQARAQLRAQGLLPSAINQVGARERGQTYWVRGLRPEELSLLTRQMATLLTAGLTVEQSLAALIESAEEPMTREVLGGVKTEVIAGLSLSAALGSYSRSFPDFYRALVHGGEESGTLPLVLRHLAEYLDARQALKQKTSLALLYPALVTIIAIIIVAGLLMYVVPQVVQVFQHSRQSLPLLTRALIGLSDFLLMSWPYLIIAIAGGGLSARVALRRDNVRYRWHALLLRTAWLGSLIRSSNTSRFASTLSILIGGGVPLLKALSSGARVMSNMVMRKAIENTIEQVREGASLSRALRETRVFPPLLVHLVASGEMSGKLKEMLERAAQLEAQALERRLGVFLTLLEPIMILVMGGVVLMIVLAILLPIMEINQLVH
ncbi:type II secretion system inner membrane protein GspF [Nitrosospira multiformis]|uniref:Type II secretion system protein F (GspF) n=1 Tax=Nitrosospira multiformis TaxID=1231 RepID=A0A1I7FRC1_9PROT|nr:type II secretion system inner membrane protein GspF [Nitrosospira multiformis]SFU38723.1 type II secretion system protein F (GspF) [Nitrosospira multiformis]